jgi:hypothetical protein
MFCSLICFGCTSFAHTVTYFIRAMRNMGAAWHAASLTTLVISQEHCEQVARDQEAKRGPRVKRFYFSINKCIFVVS